MSRLVSEEEWRAAMVGLRGMGTDRPWRDIHVPVMEIAFRHLAATGEGEDEVDRMRWVCLRMYDYIDQQAGRMRDILSTASQTIVFHKESEPT